MSIWISILTSKLLINLNKKKPWFLLPQHQRIYPRGPGSVSTEIPTFNCHFQIFFNNCFLMSVSQCSHLEVKGGISVDAYSMPLGYVLWCRGSKSQDFSTFIQIGSGHTVFDQLIEETNERSKMMYEFLCLKILCIF